MKRTTESLPPLNALRAFEAAGVHLNFRVAAEKLGVTQGAVAQQVRALEAQLGLRLFERQPRTLAFTGAGRAYHQEVAEAFGRLRAATASLRPRPERATVSVTPTFASKWLIPRLPDFTAQHPRIDLRILATESLSRFHGDGIDLAVRQAAPPFGASLDAELLFRQEIVAVCAPYLLPGPGVTLGLKDLERFALLQDTHVLWPAFLEKLFGSQATEAVAGTSFNQTSLAIDAALAGQGIALASRFLVDRDLQEKRLVQPLAGSLRGEKDFYLIAPQSARRAPATDAVWQWLLSQRDQS